MLLGKADMTLVPNEILWEYGAKDAIATYLIQPILEKKLKKEDRLNYYTNYVLPTAKNLMKSSIIGIKIDASAHRKMEKRLNNVLKYHRDSLLELSELKDFNPNSPDHVATVLFDHLKLEPQGKTPKGAYKTSMDVLDTLYYLTQHEFIKILREYKKLEKVFNTYVTPIHDFIDEDWFIHPKWKVVGTKTGRITSEDPATTTQPRDKEYEIFGNKIKISLRSFYACPEGYEVLYWDVKQGELRCLAVLAGDDALMDVFTSGRDPHDEVARQGFKIKAIDSVTKEQRNLAKTINFGLVYGATPTRVHNDTGVEMEIVEGMFAEHKKMFPRAHAFLDNIPQIAFSDGFLDSPFGTRKHVVSLVSNDSAAIAKQEREFRNYLPQNTCAMITTKTFNKVCDIFRKHKFGKYAWPCNLVYDSGMVIYKKKYQKEVREIVMEAALSPVPEMDNTVFPISLGVGGSWSEAEQNAEDYSSL